MSLQRADGYKFHFSFLLCAQSKTDIQSLSGKIIHNLVEVHIQKLEKNVQQNSLKADLAVVKEKICAKSCFDE